MTRSPVIYASPAAHCRYCEFSDPCQAMMEARDPEPLLLNDFRQRTDEAESKPRLGQATWGFGRGAAPPQW